MATRELKTRITADNSDLKRGLNDSEKQVGSFGNSVKRAGIALAAAFAARAILGGIKKMVVELGNMADRLLDLEQITGISTDRLQEYQQVAIVAGVNSEALANAVQGLTRRLAGATTEASPLNSALKKLGIESKTANGELRNGADIMEEAISKLAAMQNRTERNVLGAQLFGGAWKDIAPILALGADGIEKARKQAHELGLVMDKEALEKANQFRIELETLNKRVSQIGKNIGMFLIPILLNMANGFRSVKDAIKEVWAETTKRAIAGDMEEINDLAQRYLGAGLVSTLDEGQQRAAKTLLASLEKQRNYWIGYYGDIDKIADREERIYARNRLAGLDAQIAALQNFSVQSVEVEEERIGEIERLQAQIAQAEAGYIKANSDLERARHLERIDNLTKEIALLEQAARGIVASRQQEAVTQEMGAPQRIQPGAPAAITIAPIDPEAIVQQNLFNKALEETERLQLAAAEAARIHAEQMEALKFISEDAAFSIGEALGSAANKGGEATAKMIAQALAAAMAQIIRWYATTLPPPLSLAAIGASGAILGLMKSQIPAFADGGMVYGPTMGMVGEYASARTNPEVIAPLDKLEGMLGGVNGDVRFIIKGDVLWGVLQRYNSRLNQNS